MSVRPTHDDSVKARPPLSPPLIWHTALVHPSRPSYRSPGERTAAGKESGTTHFPGYSGRKIKKIGIQFSNG